MHLLYVYLKDEKLNVEEFYFIEKIRDFFGVIFVHCSHQPDVVIFDDLQILFFSYSRGFILYKMHII